MGQDSTVRAAVGVFGKEKGQALITTEVTDKSKWQLAQGHRWFNNKLQILRIWLNACRKIM